MKQIPWSSVFSLMYNFISLTILKLLGSGTKSIFLGVLTIGWMRLSRMIISLFSLLMLRPCWRSKAIECCFKVAVD